MQIDNERVIVTEWTFAPGAETGWHTHEHDYLIVPITTGKLMIESDEDVHWSSLTSGASYERREGTRHNVVNDNDFEFVFIEIEMRYTST